MATPLAKVLKLPTALAILLAPALLLLSSPDRALAAGISVTPMLIEKSQRPNTSAEFSFSVRANDKTDITLRPYDMAQLATGYMGFSETAPSKNKGQEPRLELETTRLTLPKEKAVKVSGKIKLPSRARGTWLFAVMVQEVAPEKQKKGISIAVRYAVVIKVTVIGKKYRARGRFEEIRLARHDGRLILSGLLTNTSPQDYRVESIAQVRGADNRLVETVRLRSKAAWQKEEALTWIFPAAQVRLFAPLKKLTQPGTYRLRIFNRLGSRGQTVVTQTLHVRPEDVQGPPGKTKPSGPLIAVNPDPIPVKVRKDLTAFSVFTLSNLAQGTVEVRFPVQPSVSGGESRADFAFLPQELQILPGRKKRVILKQRLDRVSPGKAQVFQAEFRLADGEAQPLPIHARIEPEQKKRG